MANAIFINFAWRIMMNFKKILVYALTASFVLGATFVASANRSRNSGITRKKPKDPRSGRSITRERRLENIHRESKKGFERGREDNERGHEDFNPGELNREIESAN
ncbi:MAG: hypothetical protein CME68_10480 [Halobacteriovoraceae bacterium]|nr:hypothetical protein [Halobacteriovoraceae bacterium]